MSKHRKGTKIPYFIFSWKKDLLQLRMTSKNAFQIQFCLSSLYCWGAQGGSVCKVSGSWFHLESGSCCECEPQIAGASLSASPPMCSLLLSKYISSQKMKNKFTALFLFRLQSEEWDQRVTWHRSNKTGGSRSKESCHEGKLKLERGRLAKASV